MKSNIDYDAMLAADVARHYDDEDRCDNDCDHCDNRKCGEHPYWHDESNNNHSPHYGGY